MPSLLVKNIKYFFSTVGVITIFIFIFSASPAEAALNSGLVSFWGLNESSGTRSDGVGTNNMSVSGSAVSGTSGIVGSSAQFQDGTTGYLTVPDNSSFNTSGGDFSISLWVYLDNKVGTQVFASKYLGSGYAIYYESLSHAFVFSTYAGNDITIGTSLGDPNTGTWYHIVGIHDSVAKTNTIRIDDQYQDTITSVTDQPDTSGPFTIGAFSNGAYITNGRVDAVGFWKRKLTSAEVTQLYNSGSGLEISASDVTAPVISSVASTTNQTTATITWNTDENATSSVEYGTTTSYGLSSSSATFATTTSFRLTSLIPGTTYYYRVSSTDYNNNLATSTALTFTTTASSTINPVGYWKLDETVSTSNAVDEIGTNDGVQSGTPVATTTVPNVNFIDIGSRVFDGNNYFTINRPVQDNFTICAWIKTTSTGGGTNHWESAPIMDSEWGGLANDFGFGIGNGGRLMYGNGGSYDSQVNGSTVINDNAWHNVCATRNNTTGAVKLYVDAQLDGSGITSTGTLSRNPYARIGYGYDGAAHYVGLIDDVRVYNTDLSQSQILSIFQGNNDANTPPVTSSGGCSTTTTTINGLTYTTSCGVTTVTGISTSSISTINAITVMNANTNAGSSTVSNISNASSSELTLAPSHSYYQFPRNLKKGMTGDDIMKLQQFLNTHGFILASSGAGSPGSETTLFSSKTESAVMKFQSAHAVDILAPLNFTKPTGWFYSYTRMLANKILQNK